MATKKTNAKTTKSTPATRKAKRSAAVASNADHIVTNKHTSDGAYVFVEAGDGRSFTRLRSGDTPEFRALSGVGKPYVAALAYHNANPAKKPQARLARGVDAHNSPQSAAAVAAQRKGGKATPAPKAGKNKAPARGQDRDYTRGKTEIKANPESWRYHMLQMICKATNTAKAKAAHAKSGKFSNNKLDFNYAAANGYINWAK